MIKKIWLMIKRQIKTYFLTGIIVIVPIFVTVYAIFFIVKSMDKLVMLLPKNLHPDTYLPFHIPGLGVILTFFLIITVGALAKNIIGKKIVGFGDFIFTKIPFVRGIYGSIKQLTEAIFVTENNFKRVVLLEYPRKGIYCIAFVTSHDSPNIIGKGDFVNLFVPTTPNPTSGFYIMVKKDDVIPLTLSVEEAFKLIMSGGIVKPVKKT